ncbi:S8 family serine peptidase [Dactylosporangium sp. CA-139066]|uniref:S8 family serine peptidase n=1 Tax=Dactylosporangium sp. CA-139066 TaxID=3239930 RepID=UPI003D8E6E56
MRNTRRRGRRSLLRVAAAAAALLPVALGGASGGPQALASGVHRASSAWASNIWMGTAGSGAGLSLADVRNVIGASTGAAAGLTGAGVGVALIDTGIAPVPGIPASQVINGPDLSFESQSSSLRYLDTYGHGTHMAGIIIANDTATGTVGLAPKAKLTSIKVGTSNGAVDASQMIAAIDWVVAHRNDDPANPIRVINLSYGTGGTPNYWTDPVQFAAEQAWKAGIVVVAAVGNSGKQMTDPATDQFILNVGSTDTNGTLSASDDTISTFTSLTYNGPANRRTDLLAPGQSILSLADPGSNIDGSYASARVGTTLFRGSGTSQATAVTSAAVALLLQARPSLTPDQAKYLLMNNGTVLTAGNAAGLGYRELNLNGALAAATPNVQQTYTWSTGTGLIEDARGGSHVVRDNVTLTGEATVWGAVSTTDWASRSASQAAWSGGQWMGYQVSGSGWTGTSWASKTWAAATWSGGPWGGSSSWTDPGWSGHYWSGHYWSTGTWTGHYWSSDDWSTAYWG